MRSDYLLFLRDGFSLLLSSDVLSMRGTLFGWLLFSGMAVAATASDLLSKAWIFQRLGMPGDQPPIILIPDMLALRTNLNEGALFGMGQGLGLVFAAISLVALTGIGIMTARLCRGLREQVVAVDLWSLAALGLITGGILGNLYDRLGVPGLTWHAPLERFGKPVLAVRDWIHFAIEDVIDWPIFNLADSYLVVGAAILVVVSLIQPRAVCESSLPQPPDNA